MADIEYKVDVVPFVSGVPQETARLVCLERDVERFEVVVRVEMFVGKQVEVVFDPVVTVEHDPFTPVCWYGRHRDPPLRRRLGGRHHICNIPT